jgi:voltage-gated potassium channel
VTTSPLTPEQQRSAILRAPGYELFIIVVTVVSLVNWIFLILPINYGIDIHGLLLFMEPILTVILLIDFGIRLHRSRPHRWRYMNHGGGWFDLLGSLPYGRLLRLFRLWRVSQAFQQYGTKNVIRWFVLNRAKGTLFLVFSLLLIVLEGGGILVLHFEAGAPGSNIETGGEALWWGVVTITTVGYGNFYPVTAGGQVTATVMIFAGVALVGIFTAWAASVFMAPPPAGAKLVPPNTDPADPKWDPKNAPERLLDDLRARIDDLEHALKQRDSEPKSP